MNVYLLAEQLCDALRPVVTLADASAAALEQGAADGTLRAAIQNPRTRALLEAELERSDIAEHAIDRLIGGALSDLSSAHERIAKAIRAAIAAVDAG